MTSAEGRTQVDFVYVHSTQRLILPLLLFCFFSIYFVFRLVCTSSTSFVAPILLICRLLNLLISHHFHCRRLRFLPACPPTCMYVCISVFLSVCLSISIFSLTHTSLSLSLSLSPSLPPPSLSLSLSLSLSHTHSLSTPTYSVSTLLSLCSCQSNKI